MTAPDRTTWTVAEDGWGDPTIWTDPEIPHWGRYLVEAVLAALAGTAAPERDPEVGA